MKKVFSSLILSLPLFILWFCTASTSGKEKQSSHSGTVTSDSTGYKNVAILELFTSQGCSSCPPADRLLGTYSSKEHVIALSFHVDYWDRLGWKDPFSSKAFTERQHDYASKLNSDVYTPQLIINGQSEMVGSDESKLSATLKKIFQQEAESKVSIKSLRPENGKVNINFTTEGNIANSVLNIALVQKKATTDVKAGENGGATLINYNVVRNFKTIARINNGENVMNIDLPAGADQKNMSVVLFLQEKGTNKISGADEASL
jgi:hypothetical protein